MTPSQRVKIAVVGTSAIGQLHAKRAAADPNVQLAGVSGLDDGALDFARKLGVPLHRDYRELVDRDIDGVVIATPNKLHLEMGTYFAEQGVHLLIEKPIGDNVADGKELCAVAARHKVQLLVGHHRRYNSLVVEARRVVSNEIGDLVAVNTVALMRKPDAYYSLDWKRSASAGPLLANFVHDVDLLRVVCGEIDSVQAAGTKRLRHFEFDDTAAIVLHFGSGALGTAIITDSTPSPWSWEASVSEGLRKHRAGQDYAHFGGTKASLSFPSMTLWSYDPAEGEVGWKAPLRRTVVRVAPNDPYADQISHFAAVCRGIETPRVSGVEGLRSLAVVAAVIEAAQSGAVVDVDDLLNRV